MDVDRTTRRGFGIGLAATLATAAGARKVDVGTANDGSASKSTASTDSTAETGSVDTARELSEVRAGNESSEVGPPGNGIPESGPTGDGIPESGPTGYETSKSDPTDDGGGDERVAAAESQSPSEELPELHGGPCTCPACLNRARSGSL